MAENGESGKKEAADSGSAAKNNNREIVKPARQDPYVSEVPSAVPVLGPAGLRDAEELP